MDALDWESLWSVQGREHVELCEVLGDLLLVNGCSKVHRFQELICKLERSAFDKANKNLEELEERRVDQGSPAYPELIRRLEIMNEDRARARLSLAKEYQALSDEKITPDFLRKFQLSKESSAKLADIVTENHPNGLGEGHGDLIFELFNEKFRPIREGTIHGEGLAHFLLNPARHNILDQRLTDLERESWSTLPWTSWTWQ